MYARPKLTDSVSVEELLTMRECGLGNAEIAKRLDTSPATIYKYIGKQPKELNKPTGWHAHKARLNPIQPTNVVEDDNIPSIMKPDRQIFTCDADEIEQEPRLGGLKVVSRLIHAESPGYRYTIDGAAGTVKVSDNNTGRLTVHTTESLRSYVDELTEVLKMLEEGK